MTGVRSLRLGTIDGPPGDLNRYAARMMHVQPPPRLTQWYNAVTIDRVGESLAMLAFLPAMLVIASTAAIFADYAFGAEVFHPSSLSALLWSTIFTLAGAFTLVLRIHWLSTTLDLGARIPGVVRAVSTVRMPISNRICRREFVIHFKHHGMVRRETFEVTENDLAFRPWLENLTEGANVTLAQSADNRHRLLLLDVFVDMTEKPNGTPHNKSMHRSG